MRRPSTTPLEIGGCGRSTTGGATAVPMPAGTLRRGPEPMAASSWSGMEEARFDVGCPSALDGCAAVDSFAGNGWFSTGSDFEPGLATGAAESSRIRSAALLAGPRRGRPDCGFKWKADTSGATLCGDGPFTVIGCAACATVVACDAVPPRRVQRDISKTTSKTAKATAMPRRIRVVRSLFASNCVVVLTMAGTTALAFDV